MFTGQIPFLSPNQQCQSTEGRHFYFLLSLTQISTTIPDRSKKNQCGLLKHIYRLCCWNNSIKALNTFIKIKSIPCRVRLLSLAIQPSSSTLRICCKMQISFRLCSDLVTASIQYYLFSKWLTLSSAALGLALIWLSAVINCTNDRSSIDVFFAIATDMFWCVLHFVFHNCFLPYHTIISLL